MKTTDTSISGAVITACAPFINRRHATARGAAVGAQGHIKSLFSLLRGAVVLGCVAFATGKANGQFYGVNTLYNFTGNSIFPGFPQNSAFLYEGISVFGMQYSGSQNGYSGEIFRVNAFGNPAPQTFQVANTGSLLNGDGGSPTINSGGLTLFGGIFGTTPTFGGPPADGPEFFYPGTVFSIETSLAGFQTLHTFTQDATGSPLPNDGWGPTGDLLLSNNGYDVDKGFVLYGTTQYGGTGISPGLSQYGSGTIFGVSTEGDARYYQTLYSFSALGDVGNNSDGAFPLPGMVEQGGTLYGVTLAGGSDSGGVLFAFNTGNNQLHVLRNFSSMNDGLPTPGLTLSADGATLYGALEQSGNNLSGTIFAVGTDGNNYRILHTFNGNDGYSPNGGLLLVGPNLFGTTGGAPSPAFGPDTYGRVFAVGVNGNVFLDLYNFTGGSDGARPNGGLIPAPASPGRLAFFGTTSYGGAGGGTLFELYELSLMKMTMSYEGPLVPQGPGRLVISWDDPIGNYVLQSALAPNGPYTAMAGATSPYTNIIGDTQHYFRLAAFFPSAPVVTTLPASGIGPSTATLNGSVNPSGANTTALFRYGTTTNYGQTSTSTLVSGTNNGTATLSSQISGLSPGTLYHFQLAGSSSAGGNSGGDLTFITPNIVQAPPVVVTVAADPVYTTSAALNGSIQANGLDTTYWFQWGQTAAYGQTTVSNVVSATNTGPASVNSGGLIGSLLGATTYHFQLFGSNSAGISSGGDLTFTTATPLPDAAVETFAASNVTTSSALLQGSINPNGSESLGFFQWGTTSNYGSNTPNFYPPDQNYQTVDESNAISGLLPNTTYHYRIVGYNGGPDEAIGNDVTFTTSASVQPTPPAALTLAATSITATGATLNATVNPGGSATSAYFQYGTTTGYGTSPGTFPAGSDSSVHSFQATISGLLPGTTYHCQIVAGNSGGGSLGGDVTFTTGAASQAPPTVATLSASSVTASSAVLNGSVNGNGDGSTSAHFEYGTTASYGTNTTQTGVGGSAASFSVTLSGLAPSTTYHYRIDAANTGGTSEGADVTFTTPSSQPPPTVTTLLAGGITDGGATLNAFIVPNGADTHAYFNYGTTTGYGNTTTLQDVGSSTNQQLFQAAVSLAPNTTYHYQIVAYNSAGTIHGADATLATLPLPPSVTTLAATGVDGFGSAVLNASANPEGAGTTVYFRYGTSTNSWSNTSSTTGIGAGTSAVPVAITVTINNPAEFYYFQPVATNPGGTTYGAILSFYGGAPQ